MSKDKKLDEILTIEKIDKLIKILEKAEGGGLTATQEEMLEDIYKVVNAIVIGFDEISARMRQLEANQGKLAQAFVNLTAKGEVAPPPTVARATQTEFDPEDLMKHQWKGKKIRDGEYAQGSLAFGWDFKDKFADATVKALEKGQIEIDQYVFKLDGTLVSTKKVKK